MVSVAVKIGGRVLSRDQWTPKMEALVNIAIANALDGVGVLRDDRIERGRFCIIARRLCNDAERSRVREKYLGCGL